MELTRPLVKLPIRFDAEALEAQVRALPGSAWVPHPTGYVGNEAVRLITPGGESTDDLKGEMGPTEHLLASPYIMEIMASIGSVWGRSRLMGLGAGADVPVHVDSHYYWRTHWRIHIPAITNPEVIFNCGGDSVHMKAGECWVFDSFRVHGVHNGGTAQRIHLVLDTVGGGRLRQLIEAGERGGFEEELVKPGTCLANGLLYERTNSPAVMSPWEIRAHVAYLSAHTVPHPLLGAVLKRVDDFVEDWAALWAQYQTDEAGWDDYLKLRQGLLDDLTALRGSSVLLKNTLPLYLGLDHMVLQNLFGDAAAAAARAAGEVQEQRIAS
ncbi:MAG: aspartyl/asparaginyl beta-hydroxylase domain-containing protein [Sphingomonas sp.]